jgi:carbon-monoxide dehydrogenase medium subunit
MAPTPVRGREAEAALNGSTPGEGDLREIAQLAVADCNPSDDVHASAEYRKHVGAHLAERALDRALGEARSG